MSGRSRAVLAAVLLAAAIAAAVFGPDLAILAPRGGEAAPASSGATGAWFCPHGGGEEWRTTITVANPGTESVTVRVTTFAEEGTPSRTEVLVPGGETRRVSVDAPKRESASMVEYFGGWVAAGWVSRAGGEDRGVAAEPCVARTSDVWYLPDASTVEDEDDAIVLLNPFSVDAVVSVTLLTPGRDPTRTEALTNVIVRASTTRVIRLGRTLLGEGTVSAIVDVSVGRIAAGLLAITGGSGIRAAIGYAGIPADETVLVGGEDSGRSDLVFMVPPGAAPTLAATLLGSGPEQPVAGVAEANLTPGSARAFPVATGPASAIVLAAADAIAARRHVGVSGDDGSSIGVAPAAAWVVLPAVSGGPFHPGIVLANTGASSVSVVLTPLGGFAVPITVVVPARGAVAVPVAFAEAVADVGVLVVASDGSVVAAAVSSSLGSEGRAALAVANGLPLPPGFPLG